MKQARKKWTFEEIAAEAAKFDSRAAFASESNRAYNAAWRQGILDQVCGHMEVSPIYSQKRWDRESVFAEALKFNSRAEFKRENSGAYCFAINNGFLDACCKHMNEGQIWKKDRILKVAKQFRNPASFKKSYPGAYKAARLLGILDESCAHMSKKREWTKEEVLRTARGYDTISKFKMAVNGAYKHALNNGYADEVFAHMDGGEGGFSPTKPALLYSLKVTLPDGGKLFKVGITGRDTSLRIVGMGAYPGVRITILREVCFNKGRDARAMEKAIHVKFRDSKYRGEPVMKNGNTELFTENVLDLFRLMEV